MTTTHLHEVDYPLMLQILDALLGGRAVGGFDRLHDGANVDWVMLENSGLSTTEKAAVTIARGIAIIEVRGGFPGDVSVANAVGQAVEVLRLRH